MRARVKGLMARCLGTVLLFSMAAMVSAAPLQVVTTISQLGDVAREIAGDRAQVSSLMGEGVDPHTYRQTRSDIARLGSADLVLWNGLYLEAQLEDLLRELAQRQPVVAVAEQLSPERLLSHEDYVGKFDPHVWMDVGLWMLVVEAVRDALIQVDPDGEQHYQDNAQRYLARLAALRDYVSRVLATVPEAQRVVISAHDAFNYFGVAYDYEVVGIQGLSTESEAGLARIESLVSLLVERGIGAVFVESSVADRNVRALIEGAAAQGHQVVIGGELYSDAMGAPGTYEGTYIGMLDHNATVITRALGGDAPADGLNQQLAANP